MDNKVEEFSPETALARETVADLRTEAAWPLVQELVEAMGQLLDDMGKDGACVCPAAKAAARIAYEPFADQAEKEFLMPLEEARKILGGMFVNEEHIDDRVIYCWHCHRALPAEFFYYCFDCNEECFAYWGG